MSHLRLRYLGHSGIERSAADACVVVDPFLTGNPKATLLPDEMSPTVICLTHGHADHLGDTAAIAKRTGAEIVAVTELAQELAGEGLKTHDPNLGGTVRFPWGSVKIVPAWHTSTTPSGTTCTPTGLLLEMYGRRIYHLGDTALFSDMALVARGGVDIALVPIGGHYTMDRRDALAAVQLIKPRLSSPFTATPSRSSRATARPSVATWRPRPMFAR